MNPQPAIGRETAECPECGHPISRHGDKYGCEYERGDVLMPCKDGGDVMAAEGPCGCKWGQVNSHSRPSGNRINKKRTKRPRSAKGESSGDMASNRAPVRSYESTAPAKSRSRARPFSETAPTNTGSSAPHASGDFECHSGLLNVFQFLNIENPSRDDIKFLQCVRRMGFLSALPVAMKFKFKSQRTAQAIRDVFFGYGLINQ